MNRGVQDRVAIFEFTEALFKDARLVLTTKREMNRLRALQQAPKNAFCSDVLGNILLFLFDIKMSSPELTS